MIGFSYKKSTLILLLALLTTIGIVLSHNGQAEAYKAEVTAKYKPLTMANKKLPDRFLLPRLANKTPFDRVHHETSATESEASAPSEPIERLRLSGMVRTEIAKRARIEDLETQTAHWISAGETVFGWRLQSIGNESVKLHRDGTTIQLFIYPGKNADKESQE